MLKTLTNYNHFFPNIYNLIQYHSSVFSQKVVTRHNCVLSKQPIKSLN